MIKRVRTMLNGKTDNVLEQFIRYSISGGGAFVVDFGLLYLLTSVVGIHYLISAAISFCVGVIINYVLSTRWVFAKRNIQNRKAEFLIFAAVGFVGLIVNEFVLYIFTEYAGFHYLISKIIATALIFAWNFVGRKILLFR